jgi:hypothetical protein
MITYHSWNCRLRVDNDSAILHIEALDLSQLSSRTQELCHNGHFLRCVYTGFTLAVKVLYADTIRVEVTAIRIAAASIAIERVCAAAFIVLTDRISFRLARVWGQSRGDGVRLPDIHLGARSRQIGPD